MVDAARAPHARASSDSVEVDRAHHGGRVCRIAEAAEQPEPHQPIAEKACTEDWFTIRVRAALLTGGPAGIPLSNWGRPATGTLIGVISRDHSDHQTDATASIPGIGDIDAAVSLPGIGAIRAEKSVQYPRAGLNVLWGVAPDVFPQLAGIIHPGHPLLQQYRGSRRVAQHITTWCDAPKDDLIQDVRITACPSAWNWDERQFEFPWPPQQRQYYLEQVDRDTYRRVPLADRAGYAISVSPAAGNRSPSVQIQFTKKTITGGQYDDAIRAYVGRPALVDTVVTTRVPIRPDDAVLLVWLREASSGTIIRAPGMPGGGGIISTDIPPTGKESMTLGGGPGGSGMAQTDIAPPDTVWPSCPKGVVLYLRVLKCNSCQPADGEAVQSQVPEPSQKYPAPEPLTGPQQCISRPVQENQRLRLEAFATSRAYMVGEPIFVTLRFTGLSSEKTRINLGHVAREAILCKVRDTTYTSDYLQTQPGGASRIYQAWVSSAQEGTPPIVLSTSTSPTKNHGNVYEHRILLNEWVRFEQPGTYDVQILYDSARAFGRGEQIKTGCVAKLEIVPADERPLQRVLEAYYDAYTSGGPHFAMREHCILALCYSGANQALPFLEKLIADDVEHHDSALDTELFKGVRRIGTHHALDLLSNILESDETSAGDRWMAMTETFLIAKQAEDASVKSRAQRLIETFPEQVVPRLGIKPQVMN